MPHITIETDRATVAEIDADRFVSDLHNTLAAQDTINKSSLKTRFYVAEASMVGEAEGPSFVAVTVKLLPGRSGDLKGAMADALLEIVRRHAPEAAAKSVEFLELGIYRK